MFSNIYINIIILPWHKIHSKHRSSSTKNNVLSKGIVDSASSDPSFKWVHSHFTIEPYQLFSEISLLFSKILNFKLQINGSLQKWITHLFTTENWKKLTGFIFFKKLISSTEKGLKGTDVNRASFENAVTVPLKSDYVLKYILRPNQTVFGKSVL